MYFSLTFKKNICGDCFGFVLGQTAIQPLLYFFAGSSRLPCKAYDNTQQPLRDCRYIKLKRFLSYAGTADQPGELATKLSLDLSPNQSKLGVRRTRKRSPLSQPVPVPSKLQVGPVRRLAGAPTTYHLFILVVDRLGLSRRL